jgi:hypothetical protein
MARVNRNGELIMRTPSTLLAAAVIAASTPLFAGSAAAAPLSGSLALKNSTAPSVETVQWRRHGGGHSGRWIGPAVGAAAGLAIGSALAAPYYGGGYYDGYDSYAYSPGYTYAPGYDSSAYSGYDSYGYAPRVRSRTRNGIRHRADPSSYSYGDPEYWSAYPSWQR